MSPLDSLERDAPGFSDVASEAGASFRRRWLVAPAPVNSSTVQPIAQAASGDYEVATMREGAAR